GVEAARIHDAQPQLAFRPARSGSLEVRRECDLELLLREGPAVAEQAQPELPVNGAAAVTEEGQPALRVNDDAAPAFRVALYPGQRLGERIADHGVGTHLLLAC